MNNVAIVSHNDVDGIVFSLIAKAYTRVSAPSLKEIPGYSIYHTSNADCDKQIKDIISLGVFDCIIIGDLNPSHETFNFLHEYDIEIIFVDHHLGKKSLHDMLLPIIPKMFINYDISAALIMYDELNRLIHYSKRNQYDTTLSTSNHIFLLSLATAADAIDYYRKTDGLGEILDVLLEFYGTLTLFETLNVEYLKGNVTLDSELMIFAERLIQNKHAYVSKRVNAAKPIFIPEMGDTYLCALSDSHVSTIANKLANQNPKYRVSMVVDFSRKFVRIVTADNYPKALEIATKLGGTNGNLYAAGIKFTENKNFVESLLGQILD